MNNATRRNSARTALVASLALSSLFFVSCTGAAPAGNTPATNAAAPSNAAAPTTPTVIPPQAPGDAKPPLGMEDTIEGRVVGLYCFKNNPKASLEEQKACAQANVDKGGQLGILASDNTLYVDNVPDARITNAKLRDFIGEEVTVQGHMIGDAPDLNFGDVKVKKFDMKLSRRKGSAPVGMQPNLPKPKQSDVQRPAAPTKKS